MFRKTLLKKKKKKTLLEEIHKGSQGIYIYALAVILFKMRN